MRLIFIFLIVISSISYADVTPTCASGGCVNVQSSALPSGAATSAKQDTGNSSAATTATNTSNLDVLLSTRTKPSDNQSIGMGDNQLADPSGRLRESNLTSIFNDYREYDKNGVVWNEAVSGVGAASTMSANRDTVTLTIGTGSDDYIYSQSRYIPFIPDKGGEIEMGFINGAAVTNCNKRTGYFDDNNGIFFQQSGSVKSFCFRTSTSGSPVTTCIDQSSWNLDKMDGATASGINLDTAKVNRLIMDYTWLGRYRLGFMFNGRAVYAHQVDTANGSAVPPIATPSLPFRFEVRNSGISTGCSMERISVAANSGGEDELPTVEFSTSNGVTPRTVTNPTLSPVIAIRMASTFNGKTNRKTAKLIHTGYRALTNDAMCIVNHVHNVTSTTGGAWVAVNANSSVEVNTGITAYTAERISPVDVNFITSGSGQTGGGIIEHLNLLNNHLLISNNPQATSSQIFVIDCTSFNGSSSISAELNWIEVK